MKHPKIAGELPKVKSLACTQEVLSHEACQGHTSAELKLASHSDAKK